MFLCTYSCVYSSHATHVWKPEDNISVMSQELVTFFSSLNLKIEPLTVLEHTLRPQGTPCSTPSALGLQVCTTMMGFLFFKGLWDQTEVLTHVLQALSRLNRLSSLSSMFSSFCKTYSSCLLCDSASVETQTGLTCSKRRRNG